MKKKIRFTVVLFVYDTMYIEQVGSLAYLRFV